MRTSLSYADNFQKIFEISLLFLDDFRNEYRYLFRDLFRNTPSSFYHHHYDDEVSLFFY